MPQGRAMDWLDYGRLERHESLVSPRDFKRASDGRATREPQFLPDMVFVFPRPPANQTEQESSLARLMAEMPRFNKKQLGNMMDDILIASGCHQECDWGDTSSASPLFKQSQEPDAASKTRLDPERFPACNHLEQSMQRGDQNVTMVQVQDAFLEDFTAYLEGAGCEMWTFMSIDSDELYLLVSLGDPFEKAQENELLKELATQKQMKFQSNFTTQNVGLLGIEQKVNKHEEAYIRFDKREVDQAMRTFGPRLKSKEGDHKPYLFREYSEGIAGVKGSFMRTVDRVRLISAVLDDFVVAEDCIRWGVMSTYYPLHSLRKLEEFRSGQAKLTEDFKDKHEPWANFRISTIAKGLTMDPTGAQPIQEIRDYFGERIAFYFLWLSYTTTAILYALPLALVVSLFLFLRELAYDLDSEKGNRVHDRHTAIAYAIAVILFSIWSKCYVTGWDRLRFHYAELWETRSATSCIEAIRPTYDGERIKSEVNCTVWTRQCSKKKLLGLRITAYSITFVFIGLVVASVLILYRYEEVLTHRVMNCLLTLQVFLYSLIWEWVAGKLVKLANPKTDQEAKDLAVNFMFPFNFVSTYANIVFHAMYTKWGDMCWDTDCTIVLRPELFAVVIPAVCLQVIAMLKPFALFRLKLKWEDDKLEVLRRQGSKLTGEEEPRRSFLEVQSKRPVFGMMEETYEMSIMVLLIGYVLLFGFTAPGITFIILMIFLLKTRIDAFKLCTVYQRVIPGRVGADGLGQWNRILRLVAEIGRFSSSLISVMNLQYFNYSGKEERFLSLLGAPDECAPPGDVTEDCSPEGCPRTCGLSDLQKILVAVIFKLILDGICRAIGMLIEGHGSATKLLACKKEFVEAKFFSALALGDEKKRISTSRWISGAGEWRQNGRGNGERSREIMDSMNQGNLGVDRELRSKLCFQDFGLPFQMETYFG